MTVPYKGYTKERSNVMSRMLLSFALLLFAILCGLLSMAIPLLLYAAIMLGLIGLYQALLGYGALKDLERPSATDSPEVSE